MRMIATGMSLAGSVTGCMTAEHKQSGHLCNLRKQVAVICPQVSSEEDIDLHECLDKRKLSSVEDNSYSASFHPGANEWLAFWLFLVASSYFLLSKQVNYFSSCRVKPVEKVSSSNTSIPNERAENDATAVNDLLSCSESSESSNRSSSMNSWIGICTECDVYSEISDFDGASYLHSLLSLEEEDSEWLSDSMTENPSSPVSHNCDSFTEISDVGTPSYWDSLLRLEQGEDSEWISDSKQELEYVRDGSPFPSYKGSWGNEVLPSVSTISSFTGEQCGKSEDNISVEHLLETADIEEFGADNEPLFWPFEGKFNWNSEESSFCASPRRRLVSQQELYLSKTCLNEDFDSNMDYHLEREYFALDQEFPIEILVGLKEFDGHEGLDSDFIGDVFMLEESLQ